MGEVFKKKHNSEGGEVGEVFKKKHNSEGGRWGRFLKRSTTKRGGGWGGYQEQAQLKGGEVGEVERLSWGRFCSLNLPHLPHSLRGHAEDYLGGGEKWGAPVVGRALPTP